MAAAAPARDSGSTRRWADPRRRLFRVLLLPPLVFLLLFLVLPMVFMGALSFRANLSGQLLGPFDPTLKQYSQFVDTPSYLRLLLTSAGVAAIVGALATLLAYPLAYFLRFKAGVRASVYLLLLLLPFWTSYLLRVVALRLMLGEQGVINTVLIAIGLIHDPIDALLYNRLAVIVTLVYVWIPFAALPILAALQRVDPALHEAAADLYATPLSGFRRVTLPLSMPGIIVAFFMVFIPTVGEYVTPSFVGGTSGTMYGNIVQDFFTRAANWPFGSALSMIMLAATLIFSVVALKLINVRRFVQL